MSKEQDQIFLQNFIIVVVMLCGIIAIFVVIARTIGSNEVVIAKQRALIIAAETAPVASVRLSTADTSSTTSVSAVASATAGDTGAEESVGKRLHDSMCFACHGTGLAGIPQTGNVADWIDRIAQGNLMLYEHAIVGFTGASGMVMPAKGGNPSLSDEDVKAAVDYMIEVSQ
jgi:cytochrome c5